MKKIKMFAVVLGVMLSVGAAFATKSSENLDQTGYLLGACSTQISNIPDTCQETNSGPQCQVEEKDAFRFAECVNPLNSPL